MFFQLLESGRNLPILRKRKLALSSFPLHHVQILLFMESKNSELEVIIEWLLFFEEVVDAA